MEDALETANASQAQVQNMLNALGIEADVAGLLVEVQESLSMPLKAMVLSIKSKSEASNLKDIPTEPPFIDVLPEEHVVREMFLSVSETSYMPTFFLLRVIDKFVQTRFSQDLALAMYTRWIYHRMLAENEGAEPFHSHWAEAEDVFEGFDAGIDMELATEIVAVNANIRQAYGPRDFIIDL